MIPLYARILVPAVVPAVVTLATMAVGGVL